MKSSVFLESLRSLAPISAIEDTLRTERKTAYLVGGLPRDAALGRLGQGATLDVDLAVAKGARELAFSLARRFKGTAFLLHEATRIWRVAVPGSRAEPESERPVQIDVAEFQGANIEEDLARRDFTANALAVPLPLDLSGILDPHGGLSDLKRGLLRATSAAVFPEDPLRLLRAFRIAAQLDWSIETGTLRAIRRHRGTIRRSAGERIRSELMGLLSSPDAARWLELMDKVGLLTEVLPELEPSRRCAQTYYGRGGVLRHSLDAVARADFLIAQLDRVYPNLAEPIRGHLDSQPGGLCNQEALLRLAVLLHDVAKPVCARRMGGRLRFFGHESKGARTASAALRRLRFSKEESETVCTAIFHHLRPGNLAANGIISDKAVFRFFRDLGPRGVSLLLLCWADHASYLKSPALRSILDEIRENPGQSRSPVSGRSPRVTRSPEIRKTLFHLQVVSLLLERHFHRPQSVRPPKLLNGNDVMKALRVKPGPRVGEILRLLQEAQAEGLVQDRVQALRFIRSI